MRVRSNQFGAMVPASPVQHVWVDLSGRWVDPCPGLLLMWRQRLGKRAGWDGWVVYGQVDRDRIDQGWVDARLIRQAHHELPERDLSGYGRPDAASG